MANGLCAGQRGNPRANPQPVRNRYVPRRHAHRHRDPPAPPTRDALRAHVGATLPPAHAPRELVITERIVRDGLGKLSAAERDRLHALRVS